MTNRLQAIRGVNDVLPEDIYAWQHLQSLFEKCMNDYGFQEIRIPLIEHTQLFKRTIGEITDIVEKEMYTFNDLNGESISLRPEGTAGCVRACLEHGLLHNQQQKLWYSGPMFRHERPQKGRYRQFNQFGVEAFGISGVGIELEILALSQRLWHVLGIANHVQLQVNTLGELSERQAYRNRLVDYLKPKYELLDEDSKKRLDKNPLRILDSKNPAMQTLIAEAPKLMDVLSDGSKEHFQALCQGLERLGIDYVINPQLVRGLDYYGHTVFEWVTDKLGSQSTICAGGRYDKLVEQLGGAPTKAIGFAIGIERLLLLMETLELVPRKPVMPLVFIMADGDEALLQALSLAEKLRNEVPEWQYIVNTSQGSFKNQFKRADKSGAKFALIIGSDEANKKTISIKNMRENTEQLTIPQVEIIAFLKTVK